MVERRPAGFNVDLGFSDSKEVMSIPRRYRAAAIGVWTLCGSWSANKLTDGYVPAEVLKANGCTPAILQWLIVSTLWTAADAGAVWFTNWPRWQRTRDEVSSYRKAEADRKRAARADATRTPRNGHADAARTSHENYADAARTPRNGAEASTSSADEEVSARTSAGRSQDVRSEHRDPSTKTKNRELRVVENVRNSRPRDEHPNPRTCPDHPDGTDRPCRACANARRKHDEQLNAQTLASVNARQAELDAIRQCPECDDAGWIAFEDEDTGAPYVARCEHPKVANHA